MTEIVRARHQHLEAINALLRTYGLGSIDKTYLNSRDIGLCACYKGKVIGFIWLGLMRQNKSCYLDFFTIDPTFTHKGVSRDLALEALKLGNRLGVEHWFGIVERDDSHDKVAMDALKIAMFAKNKPCTYMYGYTEHMIRELKLEIK